jgi:hypothetical protein
MYNHAYPLVAGEPDFKRILGDIYNNVTIGWIGMVLELRCWLWGGPRVKPHGLPFCCMVINSTKFSEKISTFIGSHQIWWTSARFGGVPPLSILNFWIQVVLEKIRDATCPH